MATKESSGIPINGGKIYTALFIILTCLIGAASIYCFMKAIWISDGSREGHRLSNSYGGTGVLLLLVGCIPGGFSVFAWGRWVN